MSGQIRTLGGLKSQITLDETRGSIAQNQASMGVLKQFFRRHNFNSRTSVISGTMCVILYRLYLTLRDLPLNTPAVSKPLPVEVE